MNIIHMNDFLLPLILETITIVTPSYILNFTALQKLKRTQFSSRIWKCRRF